MSLLSKYDRQGKDCSLQSYCIPSSRSRRPASRDTCASMYIVHGGQMWELRAHGRVTYGNPFRGKCHERARAHGRAKVEQCRSNCRGKPGVTDPQGRMTNGNPFIESVISQGDMRFINMFTINIEHESATAVTTIN